MKLPLFKYMEKNNFIPISITKDWYLYNYNGLTHTPFKNNKYNGSELYTKQNVTKIVNDCKKNIFNTTTLKNKSTSSYEMKPNLSVNSQKIKNYPDKKNITFRNTNKCGNEINNDITNVSISKPKCWPSRGFNEI
jgi:hypothetical protein